jgi:CubicO group peptidase (beta-lactamase class C family)
MKWRVIAILMLVATLGFGCSKSDSGVASNAGNGEDGGVVSTGGDDGGVVSTGGHDGGVPPPPNDAAPPDGDTRGTDAGSPPATCATDLSAYLNGLAVPGVSAAVVKHGRVVCTAVAGTAVLATGNTPAKPVTTDTDFLWASVSKTLTATALMQLYEQGKFELDDDISKYIGFPVQIPSCPGTPVTFRELLTHTSSITDNDNIINSSPVATDSGDPVVPLGDLIEGYLSTGGKFYDASNNFDVGCPGTISDYANMGIATVGYLVQVMSGEDLYQYYQDHIFSPLGMTDSSFHLAGLDPAEIAAPNGNEASYGEADFPDGMLRTSPAQLGKFLAAFTQGGSYDGHRILQGSTVDLMLSMQTSLGSASTGGITQGLVWYTVDTFGSITWGHDGDDDGATSNMFFDPTTNAGVLMVSNGGWTGDPGAVAAMKALFEESAMY